MILYRLLTKVDSCILFDDRDFNNLSLDSLIICTPTHFN